MVLFPLTATLAALLCILTHYEVLRLLSSYAPRLAIAPRPRILVVMIGALASHLLQVCLFAAALWLAVQLSIPAALADGASGTFQEAIFISIESYASLGSGETIRFGPMRLFAGIEGLSGLLLVGWTTAFTFLAMTRFWEDHPRGWPPRS